MTSLNHIILWLALSALFTLICQPSMARGGEAIKPSGDVRPQNVTLNLGETNKTQAIPWDQIGAKAGADYHGDGLSVTAIKTGARLHCAFQRLDGEATGEGLWLVSTATNQPGDRFRVVATAVGSRSLSPQGTVAVDGEIVRFARAGLVEEYSVSMNGVRQDFVVTEKAAGDGELKVQLSVTGARVERAAYGAQLVMEKSGRKIAYGRLHVTDANGKELPGRIEAEPNLALRTPHSAITLTVTVDDAGAVYPLRIDPTFSDANWVSMGGLPGTDGAISAAVLDGSGNLYIGGSFTAVGNIFANNVAQWNGSRWSPLGSGIAGNVKALAVSGDTLYAGGTFTTAGGVSATNVAQWNGSSWLPLGLGINGPYTIVMALAVSGTNLYAGGQFSAVWGNAANFIAQWNGNTWSPLGSGMNGNVCALAVSGSTLYAGGTFSMAGGVLATNVAQWDGNRWSPLGSGIGNLCSSVNALAVLGTNLYAGGSFTTASGNSANSIAQWNGNTWSPLGSGMNSNGEVYALEVSGTNLYAGGYFTTAGGNAINCIAQWNGSSWSSLGLGMNGEVTALAASGSTLYVGGYFSAAGGTGADYVAQWNGTSWSPLGSGMSGGVRALVVSGDALYAGGDFTAAGGTGADYVAQWNGTSWSPLGLGVNGSVRALAVSGGALYAGGDFTRAGGNVVNCIAQWNGTSWSPLGSGMGGHDSNGDSSVPYVATLAVSGTNLYAGGDFTNAGGTAANYIAQWNGTSWSPLGSGFSAEVYALVTSGGSLYAGGNFISAGGTAANYIAQWNGSSWSPLGSGVDAQVYSLAASGTTLYAGGRFISAGGTTADCIAQWNGSCWSPLGQGLDEAACALAISGTNLYAGGIFTLADFTRVSYIAQWNGNSWSSLGSGVGDSVSALAVSGGTLYVGGSFWTAGGKISAYAAKATIGISPTIISQPGSTKVMARSNVEFTVVADGLPLSYQWFKNGNVLLSGGNVSGSASNSLTLTNVYVNDPGCYLVVVTNNFGSVTSSVATLTVSNLPLVLTSGPGNLGCTNKQFWLTVAGPAGSNVVVYASTNLQSWVPQATNPLSLGSLTFTDLLVTNYPGRFYRAKLSP